MQPLEFTVPFENHTLHADTLTGERNPHLFCFHGGGTRCRSVFADVRHTLHGQGIGSTALDCIGHGQTGGVFADSSLHRREQQALSVIRHSGVRPSALIGISMGAYNAVRLSETLEAQTLVLVVPGIYTPEAYKVPFGPLFSAIIRQHRSWADSDAWDILSRFKGRLLVIAGEQDDVIPLEIPERLLDAATHAQDKALLVIPDAGHNGLMPLIQQQPQWLAAITTRVASSA
ncbi:alpha/beta fold hydrolase [Pseudomonas sp. BIGb0164]|uniref:alpha/beta fold hydrolase n=1 Tax=Pseudomonas sp. BIGb0164 TaxID=2940605 RepID=UPI0021692B59|nr:alpha/beta hydrolase [Pseudomonas sp. BIGb0164]MCS4246246.1 pimeloyl-ACP methyl ester carboxylesterase [Pseudomonas sp. BIGb0164]